MKLSQLHEARYAGSNISARVVYAIYQKYNNQQFEHFRAVTEYWEQDGERVARLVFIFEPKYFVKESIKLAKSFIKEHNIPYTKFKVPTPQDMDMNDPNWEYGIAVEFTEPMPIYNPTP